MTVLQDSTHSASMSPSSTIHWWRFILLLAMSRKVVDSRPSFHSRVYRWVFRGEAKVQKSKQASRAVSVLGLKMQMVSAS